MTTELAYSIWQQLAGDEMNIAYAGQFDNSLVGHLVSHGELVIDNKEVRRSVGFIVIECVQNIMRHGEAGDDTHPVKDYFYLKDGGAVKSVTIENLVENSVIADLQNRIDGINKMDDEQLKQAINTQMMSDEKSEDGGAGMGLMMMAKRSGRPVKYKFIPLGENNSLFYNMFEISQQAEPEDDKLFRDSVAFHQLMQDNDISLIYKGNYDTDAILPVLDMLEEALDPDANPGRKVIYHVMVEMMQNITRHASAGGEHPTGMTIISFNKTKYEISTVNEMPASGMAQMKELLDEINECSVEELEEKYIKQIREERKSGKGARLGLIDIGKYTGSKISYEFKDAETGNPVVVISAVIKEKE